jgi:hypothetical protein
MYLSNLVYMTLGRPFSQMITGVRIVATMADDDPKGFATAPSLP